MSESTRSVERALDILLCFNGKTPTRTLAQITERVGLPKSTVHRLLTTLEAKRFVHRNGADGSYRLGVQLIELGASVRWDTGIADLATPHLERLSAECRETVDLAIFDGSEVVYLKVIESSQRMKIAAAPGERLPAFCTATGKVFLAFMPEDQVREILKKNRRKYTDHTQLSFTALSQSLQATRSRGYALSLGEYEDGISAVAAPILDTNQHPIAAIAVVGPTFRLPKERIMLIGKSVKITADRIAQEIVSAG